MLSKYMQPPRYFIVICAIVFVSVSALYIHSEWRNHRLKQLLIPTAEFDEFLKDAGRQRELNTLYDELAEDDSSSITVDNEIEGITVTDGGIVFAADYVFPDGFFEGLTVAEARAKIPEVTAQIDEWNAQLEKSESEVEKNEQKVIAMVEDINADVDAIMEDALQDPDLQNHPALEKWHQEQ